jgi:hypothetical protein
MAGTRLKRRLDETVAYPPHDPRVASHAYRMLHELLVVHRNEPCWICGLRNSQGGQMETHHSHIEWAAVNGVDLMKIMIDFPKVTDEASLRAWLDSEGNMLVLCARHHRGAYEGIHMISYPAWLLQRYQGPGWTFIEPKEAHRD